MCEMADMYDAMYGEDLEQYPKEILKFAQGQRSRRKRPRADSPELVSVRAISVPSHPTEPTAVQPQLKTGGKFREPKVYKGKTIRELNEFLASV